MVQIGDTWTGPCTMDIGQFGTLCTMPQTAMALDLLLHEFKTDLEMIDTVSLFPNDTAYLRQLELFFVLRLASGSLSCVFCFCFVYLSSFFASSIVLPFLLRQTKYW